MKKKHFSKIILYAFAIVLLSKGIVYSQNVKDVRINEIYLNEPLAKFLQDLQNKYHLKVFYKSAWVAPYTITRKFQNTSLLQALNNVFLNHELAYDLFQDHGIVVYRRIADTRTQFDDFYQTMVIGNPINMGRHKTALLSGRVLDGKTGEPLTGAVIYCNQLQKGTTTGADGGFELEIPTGKHQLQMSFVGFENSSVKILLIEDGAADFMLFKESHNIEEITVLGNRADLPEAQMSIVSMTGKELKQLPALMGEADVLKGLTIQAGVQSVGELSSGFNVRGGNTDQNLILINGSPSFNSSHLFGFLSLINPDVVEGVTLMKGGMPARYGERVASVMEVDFKDGNNEAIKAYGGIGTLNTRLTLEGPLTKNKKLTMVAGFRSSYADWILKELPDADLNSSSIRFYDATGKLSYKFNAHNKLSVMAYVSEDEFSTSTNFLTEYGSILGNVKLNSRFSENLYGELDYAYSKYEYSLCDYANNNPEEAYRLSNDLLYTSGGYYFKWHLNPRHNIDAGVKLTVNEIHPGEIQALEEESRIEARKIHKEKILEWSVFVGDEYKVLPQLSMVVGLRYNQFRNYGAPLVYLYDKDKAKSPESVIDSIQFAKNEVSALYGGFEPRLALRYDLTAWTNLKFSYQRARQNVFQLSNNAVISPAETWKAADYHLEPLISDQIAAGVESSSWVRSLLLATEVYYKRLQNLVDYKNGAELMMNERVETALIPTNGYSYGIELSAQKSYGRLTGYASYAYSRTKQKNMSSIEGENLWGGEYYNSIYDRPHDFSLTATYNVSRRWRFSGNFVYVSGRPTTLPELEYRFADEILIYYSERNKYRMPAYHRLDLSVTFDENLRKKRMWKGSWTFSVYNVYGRNNPYSVYYKKSMPNEENNFRRYSLYKFSIIGIPIPSLTYNFSF